MLLSVDDVIRAVGGTKAIAKLTSVGTSAVSNWRADGLIPAAKFMLIANALNDRGLVASPTLFAFKAPKRTKPAKRARSN